MGGCDQTCCVHLRLVDLDELDAVEHAGVRRLAGHFKLELISLEVLARFGVDLCQGLKQDDPREALEAEPVQPLDENVQLFALLVEAF